MYLRHIVLCFQELHMTIIYGVYIKMEVLSQYLVTFNIILRIFHVVKQQFQTGTQNVIFNTSSIEIIVLLEFNALTDSRFFTGVNTNCD